MSKELQAAPSDAALPAVVISEQGMQIGKHEIPTSLELTFTTPEMLTTLLTDLGEGPWSLGSILEWMQYHPDFGTYGKAPMDGKNYDTHAQHFPDWLAKAIKANIPVAENAKVLVIGDGTGIFSRYLKQLLPTLDLSILDREPKLSRLQSNGENGKIGEIITADVRDHAPDRETALIIGNELLDALPLAVLRKNGSDIQELSYQPTHKDSTLTLQVEWVTVTANHPHYVYAEKIKGQLTEQPTIHIPDSLLVLERLAQNCPDATMVFLDYYHLPPPKTLLTLLQRTISWFESANNILIYPPKSSGRQPTTGIVEALRQGIGSDITARVPTQPIMLALQALGHEVELVPLQDWIQQAGLDKNMAPSAMRAGFAAPNFYVLVVKPASPALNKT